MRSTVSKLSTIAAGTLAAAFLFGCTPSPEATCGKVMKLAEEDADKKSKTIKEDEKSKLREKCVSDMKEMKESDVDGYKCTAKCIKDVKEVDTAFGCMALCNYKKKSKDKDKDKDD